MENFKLFIKNFLNTNELTWTKFGSNNFIKSTIESNDWSDLILNRSNLDNDIQKRIELLEQEAISIINELNDKLSGTERHLDLTRKQELIIRFYCLVLNHSNICYTHLLDSLKNDNDQTSTEVQNISLKFIFEEYDNIVSKKIDGVHQWINHYNETYKSSLFKNNDLMEELKDDLILTVWSSLNIIRYDKPKLIYSSTTFTTDETKQGSIYKLWPISSNLVICFYLPSQSALQQGHEKLRPFNCSLVKNHRFAKYVNQSVIDEAKDKIIKEFAPHLREQAWNMWWSDNRVKYLSEDDTTTYDVIDSTETSQDIVNAYLLNNTENELALANDQKAFDDALVEFKEIFR